jgi:hypothetical protein
MLFMSVLYYTKYRVLVFFLKTHNNDEIWTQFFPRIKIFNFWKW